MALTDYTRVEYIQGADGAYIDTGLQGKRYYSYEMVFSCFDSIIRSINAINALWGAEGSANKYSFAINNTGTSYRTRYAAQSPSVTPFISSPDVTNLRVLRIKMVTLESGGTIKITDESTGAELSSGSYTYGASTTNLNRNIYVLAINRSSGGTPEYEGQFCRVHYFKIYNAISGSVEREYIPIKNAQGKGGLYDMISDTAFFSGGSDLGPGPEITDASKLWIRQSGTWNSGTPYIRQSGSWSTGKPYIRQTGSWSQGS